MKTGILIALVIVSGFVSYFGFYPGVASALGIAKKEEIIQKAPVQAPVVAKRELPKLVPYVPRISTPEPEPEPKKIVKEEKKFVPPTFASLEEITENWTKIPPSAFPRRVTLKEDVELKMRAGSSKMRAGSEIVALNIQGDILTIAPNIKSPARAQIHIDGTDFKTVLIAGYSQFKRRRTELARTAWENENNPKKPKKVVAATTTKSGGKGHPEAGPQPERSADGTVLLLIKSMESGQVTEITPENVVKFGPVVLEEINKTTYWTCVVKYMADTMFGKFEAEGKALVSQGKVTKWVYTGSGEVIP